MMKIFLIVFCVISILKICVSIYNIYYTKNILKEEVSKDINNSEERVNLLLLIPVLREQSVIERTMNHFEKLSCKNINLHIAIAGTIREELENEVFNSKITTKQIVEEWIKNYNDKSKDTSSLQYYYFEALDEGGDRSTQLNCAVKNFMEEHNKSIDVIGVYDADSLPNTTTLIEVANNFREDGLVACQQPVHFVDAANEMAINRENPILIANALYQTTWTMIREFPRWIQYYKHCKKNTKSLYKRNIYLIGHGEFISYKDYLDFKFPEYEVTDGIQLGYRLSMSNKTIKPLYQFCSDDVPRKVKQLVSQHKRWFGGCMRLKVAYNWSKNYSGNKSFLQMIDGYWSQSCWAWASLISLMSVIFGIIDANKTGNFTLLNIIVTSVLIYCYGIPILAHKYIPVKIKVRFIDWLCLPIAIGLKGIGPNLFFIESILSRLNGESKIKYTKVER